MTCGTSGVAIGPDKILTISDEEALKMIDDGALTLEVSFDVGDYVAAAALTEIPEAGIRLFANAWAEEPGANGSTILPEYFAENNTKSVLFENALLRTGRPVGISVDQGLSGDLSTATVSLHNNSLGERISGNLIVSLLDADGAVLEQQQTYAGLGSLVQLLGEETKELNFTFGSGGSRVMAVYGDLILDSNNAKLAALSFEGLAVRLADFTLDGNGNYSCDAVETALSSTLVSFVTENPNATVTVNGTAAAGSIRTELAAGNSEIKIEVTAQDGTVLNYILPVIKKNSQNNDGSGGREHAISIAATVNGSVSVSTARAVTGKKVTITASPDAGYILDALTVKGRDGAAVQIIRNDDGGYTFTMPDADVTVYATFRKNPFLDVNESDWYYDAVMYNSKNGLMIGVADGYFGSNLPTSRGMIVTILYRLEGEPEVTGANPFNDVLEGQWYTDAVVWAAENSIVIGYGNAFFGPDFIASREQMAQIFYNYAKYKGVLPSGVSEIQLIYTDKDKISGWAIDAAKYCQMSGLITRDEKGNFNPQDGTRRSEAAAIIMRFAESMK